MIDRADGSRFSVRREGGRNLLVRVTAPERATAVRITDASGAVVARLRFEPGRRELPLTVGPGVYALEVAVAPTAAHATSAGEPGRSTFRQRLVVE